MQIALNCKGVVRGASTFAPLGHAPSMQMFFGLSVVRNSEKGSRNLLWQTPALRAGFVQRIPHCDSLKFIVLRGQMELAKVEAGENFKSQLWQSQSIADSKPSDQFRLLALN